MYHKNSKHNLNTSVNSRQIGITMEILSFIQNFQIHW